MPTRSQRPLVVVSNRLPFSVARRGRGLAVERAPGGLIAAVEAALQEAGGYWIGWAGLAQEELARARLPVPRVDGIRYVPVPLSRQEIARYYSEFSNRALWPVFHYFLGRARYDGEAWRVYDQANQRFAEIAAQEAPSDATVWIHDYQLLRTPHHLRRLRPRARIAFFLHIPFPAADVFRVVPWSRPLLRGMLDADYLGFHTQTYADHFLHAAEALLGCETDYSRGLVNYEGRVVTVGVNPAGIDAVAMDRLAQDALAEEPPETDGIANILGVDRLDYTKGIHERLLAVERLLEQHPNHRGNVIYTQIAVPTRGRVPEYSELKRQVDEAVGRINGRFAERGWSPIRYLSRSVDQSALAGYYARADVALVTPLRDGMNLVAKEFVAAQVGEPGVLVLSELAGAAEHLQEAILVNPFDVDALADALDTALRMPLEERRARMAALRARVREHDATRWATGFLAAADRAVRRARAARPTSVELLQRRLGPWLGGRERTVIFLDYDGTLTPVVAHPDAARLDRTTERALRAAVDAKHLDVAVVSGRALPDLARRLPRISLTLVGNHGLELEGPGFQWRHPEVDAWSGALRAAAADLEALPFRGARLEHKGATLSWHIRGVPSARREQALRRGEAILARHQLRASRGKLVLEGRPPVDWHKGRAVLQVLPYRYGEEWPSWVRALYIGDDRTDEDAFRSLKGIGRSVWVGEPGDASASVADYVLPDPASVVRFLQWLAAGGHLGLG